jgi:hypothetical protein
LRGRAQSTLLVALRPGPELEGRGARGRGVSDECQTATTPWGHGWTNCIKAIHERPESFQVLVRWASIVVVSPMLIGFLVISTPFSHFSPVGRIALVDCSITQAIPHLSLKGSREVPLALGNVSARASMSGLPLLTMANISSTSSWLMPKSFK